MKGRVDIVGAGVIGLTAAIRLLEAGYQVVIWAEDVHPNITSSVAAAFHFVFHVGVEPRERRIRWITDTFSELCRLADDPLTGIAIAPGVILFEEPTPDPEWRDGVINFRRAKPSELLPGYVDGWVFETPIIDMSAYMPYLMNRFEACGGELRQTKIAGLDDSRLRDSQIVVNCAGLGARELVRDERVYPIRGQLIRTERPEEMEQFFLLAEGERQGLTYIIVRQNDVIIGGTAEEHCWDLTPDPQIATAMFERAVEWRSELREARILDSPVGLRPGRDLVRFEAEHLDRDRVVLQNYGHGGAGITLSWGCADEVVDLVSQVHQRLPMAAVVAG